MATEFGWPCGTPGIRTRVLVGIHVIRHASSAMLNDHLDRRSTDSRSITGERIPEQPQLPPRRERRRSKLKAAAVDYICSRAV